MAQYVEQRLVAWRLHGKQARIIELAVSGHAHTEIAERLGIRLNTLRTHVGRLLRRTEHASVDELAAQLLRDFANQVHPDE